MVPVVVTLGTLPLYLSIIGEERYGAVAILWMVLGYFGLFEIGLGGSTTQRVARHQGEGLSVRSTIVWTSALWSTGLGTLGGIVAWGLSHYFFGRLFEVDEGIRAEVLASLPWLVILLPLNLVIGVFTASLRGMERFLEFNLGATVGAVLFQAMPLLAAVFVGPALPGIVGAVFVARIVHLVLIFGLCLRVQVVTWRPRHDRSTAFHLLNYGRWMALTSLVGPLMVISDRFIIGATIGAAAVTAYTVPFNLVRRLGLLPGSLSSVLFPRFARKEDDDGRLFGLSVFVIVFAMTPIVLIGMLAFEPFLTWWIDAAFSARGWRIGVILLAGFWFNALARVPIAQLQGKGRANVVAKTHVAELVPYFVLLILGLRLFGLEGAAVAWSVRTTVDCGLLMHFAGWRLQDWLRIAVPGLAVIGLCMALLSGQPPFGPDTVALSRILWMAAMVLVAAGWAMIHLPSMYQLVLTARPRVAHSGGPEA